VNELFPTAQGRARSKPRAWDIGITADADRSHPSRDADLITPDRIDSDSPLSTRSYFDHFGNRVDVPAGLVAFSNRFVIHDSGEPDEIRAGTEVTPIACLPDDVLLFLVSSRYCDSDKLADFAWARFGKISSGPQRVQAICEFVHAKIRFSYPDASPTRCASDSMGEGVGVCGDFAHLRPLASPISRALRW
jgi:transglutaminase-like putative cysteine protease